MCWSWFVKVTERQLPGECEMYFSLSILMSVSFLLPSSSSPISPHSPTPLLRLCTHALHLHHWNLDRTDICQAIMFHNLNHPGCNLRDALAANRGVWSRFKCRIRLRLRWRPVALLMIYPPHRPSSSGQTSSFDCPLLSHFKSHSTSPPPWKPFVYITMEFSLYG